METTKGIIRPAKSEFGHKGWSYTQDGVGVFGTTPKAAYQNWLTTPAGMAASADGRALYHCHVCQKDVHLKRTSITVMAHQDWTVRAGAFALAVKAYKCPEPNCGEVYR